MNCAFTISKYLFGYFAMPIASITAFVIMGLALLHSQNHIIAYLGVLYFILLAIIPLMNIAKWLFLSTSEAFMVTMIWGSLILYLVLFQHVHPIFSMTMTFIPIIPTFKAIGDTVLAIGKKIGGLQLFKSAYQKDRSAGLYTLEEIDQMDGETFEHYVANLLHIYQFKKIAVSTYSNDKGLDVYAEHEGFKYGFQCKRWSKNIPLSAIQEIYTAKDLYGIDKAIVITNSGFTKAAIEASIKLDVILIDRKRLGEMIQHIRPNNAKPRKHEVVRVSKKAL